MSHLLDTHCLSLSSAAHHYNKILEEMNDELEAAPGNTITEVINTYILWYEPKVEQGNIFPGNA